MPPRASPRSWSAGRHRSGAGSHGRGPRLGGAPRRGGRPGPGPHRRRTAVHLPAGLPRGHRDQDRPARRGRQLEIAALRRPRRRHQPGTTTGRRHFVGPPETGPGQAQHRPRPRDGRGARPPGPAGGPSRCAGAELPAQHAGPAGARLRDLGRPQPSPHLLRHQRLRPDRAVPGPHGHGHRHPGRVRIPGPHRVP